MNEVNGEVKVDDERKKFNLFVGISANRSKIPSVLFFSLFFEIPLREHSQENEEFDTVSSLVWLLSSVVKSFEFIPIR